LELHGFFIVIGSNTILNNRCRIKTLYAQHTHTDGTCLNDYHIEKHTTITTNIAAADSITSKAVVPNAHSVNYKAGRRIMLLPGFRTEPGSAFYAYIDGCDAPEKRIEEEITDSTSVLPSPQLPQPLHRTNHHRVRAIERCASNPLCS